MSKIINECIQKYPDYFLFRMFYQYDLKLNDMDMPLSNYEAVLHENEQVLTLYEILFFFKIYTLLLFDDKSTDLVSLLAYEQYLQSLDIFDDFSESQIYAVLCLAILNAVNELAKPASDES